MGLEFNIIQYINHRVTHNVNIIYIIRLNHSISLVFIIFIVCGKNDIVVQNAAKNQINSIIVVFIFILF